MDIVILDDVYWTGDPQFRCWRCQRLFPDEFYIDPQTGVCDDCEPWGWGWEADL